jgi:hypothetical protein
MWHDVLRRRWLADYDPPPSDLGKYIEIFAFFCHILDFPAGFAESCDRYIKADEPSQRRLIAEFSLLASVTRTICEADALVSDRRATGY